MEGDRTKEKRGKLVGVRADHSRTLTRVKRRFCWKERRVSILCLYVPGENIKSAIKVQHVHYRHEEAITLFFFTSREVVVILILASFVV